MHVQPASAPATIAALQPQRRRTPATSRGPNAQSAPAAAARQPRCLCPRPRLPVGCRRRAPPGTSRTSAGRLRRPWHSPLRTPRCRRRPMAPRARHRWRCPDCVVLACSCVPTAKAASPRCTSRTRASTAWRTRSACACSRGRPRPAAASGAPARRLPAAGLVPGDSAPRTASPVPGLLRPRFLLLGRDWIERQWEVDQGCSGLLPYVCVKAFRCGNQSQLV